MSIIDELIAVLQRMQRQSEDDAMLRSIVADNRQPIHPAQVGGKVSVDGAPTVKTVGDGRGWSNTTPSIDTWRPPGEAVFNQLMDQQDALDRAARAAELAKLKGAK